MPVLFCGNSMTNISVPKGILGLRNGVPYLLRKELSHQFIQLDRFGKDN